MSQAGFETAIPAFERTQTHALGRTAIGIVRPNFAYRILYVSSFLVITTDSKLTGGCVCRTTGFELRS
jgi:hypothetical protein